jgi:hypothetical protein
MRVCVACKVRIPPPGVRAPYERADGGAVRQVKSQRERDTEAIGLAQHKGVMLAELAGLAADDRIDPASVPIIEWFREQVKDAGGGDRLAELAALLPDSGIRRRRWWQGSPAAIGAGYDDEDDEYDDEDGAGEEAPVPGAAGVDYAAELAAREWVWRPHGPNLCQLIHMKPHGWDYVAPQECVGRAVHVILGGAVCGSCYDALNTHRG